MIVVCDDFHYLRQKEITWEGVFLMKGRRTSSSRMRTAQSICYYSRKPNILMQLNCQFLKHISNSVVLSLKIFTKMLNIYDRAKLSSGQKMEAMIFQISLMLVLIINSELLLQEFGGGSEEWVFFEQENDFSGVDFMEEIELFGSEGGSVVFSDEQFFSGEQVHNKRREN